MKCLDVYVPEVHIPELKWLLSVILGDFFGLNFEVRSWSLSKYRLQLDDKCIEFPDIFLQQARKSWLRQSTVPIRPQSYWDLGKANLNISPINNNLPIIFGTEKLEIFENRVLSEFDIFGSCFFFLSRYEEYVLKSFDQHGRFEAKNSFAYKNDILDRAIVNEYIEILWTIMALIWPNLIRKERKFQQIVSCDVDHPYEYFGHSSYHAIRKFASKLLYSRNLNELGFNIKNYFSVKSGNYKQDSYYSNLFFIMENCERYNSSCCFYFICDNTSSQFDGDYSLNDTGIADLIRIISSRGHAIGLHCSYDSYCNKQQIKKEFDILKNFCENLGINQSKWRSRQHYLRINLPLTLYGLEESAVDIDSTMGFADHAGFRCGTCYEFQLFDLLNRCALNLREQPLILMENSVISNVYMNLGYSEVALEYMLGLKKTCQHFRGDFALLWHNSSFSNEMDFKFYNEILKT
jgi:hypothetical protein